MNKNIMTALAVAIVVVLGVSFRHQIKTFLFGGSQDNAQESPIPSFSFSPLPSVSETPFASVSPQITPVSFQLPAYHGRPTEELRPVPDEVRLFSESDKQDIYRSLQNFGKTVKEKPNFLNGWIQLGLLKKTIGDFEGARDAWEYASLISPKNSVSFANLGELYWRYLHVYPQAEINFKVSIKNSPSDPGTYVSLSDLYFYSLKEKSNLADDILLQGIVANPQSMDLTKALARLYEKSGQYAQAIEWWQKVLANDPKNSDLAATIEGLKKKLPGQ
ncbi:MAG: tetratricopeptide repeat protein [Patescibacteria group bacterium]